MVIKEYMTINIVTKMKFMTNSNGYDLVWLAFLLKHEINIMSLTNVPIQVFTTPLAHENKDNLVAKFIDTLYYYNF